MFAQALRDNPKLAALYLGYEDSDFFMVRSLRNERLKKIFDAPANAASRSGPSTVPVRHDRSPSRSTSMPS